MNLIQIAYSTTCICTQGAQVWLADPTEVWQPGKVVEPLTDGHMVVEREKGGGCEEVTVCSSADLPPLRNPDILVGANDLTSLSYLHEPAGKLLHLIPRPYTSEEGYSKFLVSFPGPHQALVSFPGPRPASRQL